MSGYVHGVVDGIQSKNLAVTLVYLSDQVDVFRYDDERGGTCKL